MTVETALGMNPPHLWGFLRTMSTAQLMGYRDTLIALIKPCLVSRPSEAVALSSEWVLCEWALWLMAQGRPLPTYKG